jgi:hypothetical protein
MRLISLQAVFIMSLENMCVETFPSLPLCSSPFPLLHSGSAYKTKGLYSDPSGVPFNPDIFYNA